MRFILFLFVSTWAWAQGGNEIYLGDLVREGEGYRIENLHNITHYKGYDNQPFFDEQRGLVYFTSDRSGSQTDVFSYNLNSGELVQHTRTPASEFSPQIIPGTSEISTVRIDEDTVQRFWAFQSSDWTQAPRKILDLEGMGYSAWISQNKVFFFMVGQDALSHELVYADLDAAKVRAVERGIGRCVQADQENGWCYFTKPTPEGVQGLYVAKDLKGKGSYKVFSLAYFPADVQDYALVDQHTVWAGKGEALMKLDLRSPESGWRLVQNIGNLGIKGITRLAVSTTLGKVALVVPESEP